MNNKCCHVSIMVILAIVLFLTGCESGARFLSTDRDRRFNEGWKFIRDSLPNGQAGLPANKAVVTGAEQPGYDDSQWMTLDLPHDWSIADLPGEDRQDQVGPFSKSSPGATATGYVMGGTAWYRKHFKLHKADAGKTIVLRFDGVYMESEVWVNGKPAGNHVYGYTPFWFDITALLNKTGEDNVIAVKVNNTGRNSRWYSGSGICRNVHLTVTDPVHVSVWGVHVTTSEISAKAANINLAVTVQNDAEKDVDARVTMRIIAPGTENAGKVEGNLRIVAREKAVFNQQVTINKPVLWSLSSPGLYRAEVTIEAGGRITDRFTQSFGIRSVEVSAEKGFLLNGEPLELKGGCMHHDNGLLGSAAFDRAEERRVEIMKANGFNAIRTSHNPPSEAFLNACDRLGMLVIDETFDMWERPKNPQDYHRFFKEWWKKDVEAMILRDRNHPCIIFWSIGNEINERADTSGIRIARSLISFIQQFDTTRPFTNAICEFWDNKGIPWDTTANAFELLTVGGYNYQYLRYESDHEKFPGRIMMGTESVPKDAFENWQQVEKHSYVIGDFVWTGMDYLGETGIGHTQYFTDGQQDVFAMPWPWFNAWCGDIDIIGDKKPQMLYRDVIWGNSKIEMNVHAPVPEGKTEKVSYWGWPDEYPHWNWSGNEDKLLQVSVYTKGTAVKLLLNGREIGYKEVSPETKLTATFDVPYEPGELKALAFKNDREIAVKVLRTTGVPAGIRLITDRKNIKADRNDLSFITIEIIDEFGQVVTDAASQVKLTLAGNGELIGSGNACPFDMESFGKPVITTYHGKAMAIVRPFAKAGTITLKAERKGLKEGQIEIRAE
jgi:beta-galactosidase